VLQRYVPFHLGADSNKNQRNREQQLTTRNNVVPNSLPKQKKLQQSDEQHRKKHVNGQKKNKRVNWKKNSAEQQIWKRGKRNPKMKLFQVMN
jgi:hypothetical protein